MFSSAMSPPRLSTIRFTMDKPPSGGGRSGLLCGKATGLGLPSYDAPASVTSVRSMASRPTRSRAVRSNSPRSILARPSPPSRGPALLDHVAEHEDEVRLHGFVLAEAVAQHGDGANSLPDGGDPRGLLHGLADLLLDEVHEVEDESGEFVAAGCHEMLRGFRCGACTRRRFHMGLPEMGRAEYAAALGLPRAPPGAVWPLGPDRRLPPPARARSRTDDRFPGYTWGQQPPEIE